MNIKQELLETSIATYQCRIEAFNSSLFLCTTIEYNKIEVFGIHLYSVLHLYKVNPIYNIHNPKDIRLLTQLRFSLSYLNKQI